MFSQTFFFSFHTSRWTDRGRNSGGNSFFHVSGGQRVIQPDFDSHMIDHTAASSAASFSERPRHHERLAGAFSSLLLELPRTFVGAGYQRSAPIQERDVRPILKGGDMPGSSPTGTGRAATINLPLLLRLIPTPPAADRNGPHHPFGIPETETTTSSVTASETNPLNHTKN